MRRHSLIVLVLVTFYVAAFGLGVLVNESLKGELADSFWALMSRTAGK